MTHRGRACALPRCTGWIEPPQRRSVLEALADIADGILGHELGARVEVGRRDAAVDLQIELHHRPEALQEGLLPKSAGQIAALHAFLLGWSEIEAVGADLATHLELGDSLDQRRREDIVAGK